MEYKRCYNCKWWATRDTGYSNFTIEETEVTCLKKHFETIEESYSWNIGDRNQEDDHEFFKQAENCNDYQKGVGIRLDVEGDITLDDYKDDIELYNAAIECNI